MAFSEKISDWLKGSTKQKVEKLEEQLAVQQRMLEDQSPQTLASSLSREQRIPQDETVGQKKRVKTAQLYTLFLTNQFINRGITVRADELAYRGFNIVDGTEEQRRECMELIERSGGEMLFKQLSINTDWSGNGYLELVPNSKQNKIVELRHIHPITFGFWTRKSDESIVLDKNKKPEAYMQIVYDEEGHEQRIKVPKSRIAHLRYNMVGDEFQGVSTIQPVYNTAIRLMNMENSAAVAAVKTANPLHVIETKFKNTREVLQWAKIFGDTWKKQQILLPDSATLKTVSPGTQNFSEYADYFLDAVVASLGVPKPILTGTAGDSSGNRSILQKQSSHFYTIIRSNQRAIERVFDSIFERYAELAGWSDVPKLRFDDLAEDADRTGQRAVELFGSGLITIEEARELLGLDTDERVLKQLTSQPKSPKNRNLNPNDDMKVWHPSEPGSPEGSQKGEKAKKKNDPNVPSVK